MIWLWLGLGGVALLAVLAIALWLLRPSSGSLREARALFELQRSQLEQRFFEAAAASGKPRGLRWKACEWTPGVEFARERSTRKLTALVSVTIQFEAIEGGEMEGLPAVGNLRNASAVFFYHDKQWQTTGKTVYNLNPDEALNHFKNQYERLETKDL